MSQGVEGSNCLPKTAWPPTSEYTANELNQYTSVGDFTPTFDADGNQTLVKTSAGIWSITYDAENRPVSFTNAESNTVVECAYDHMGRRATKKVTVDGAITLHQRYLYRGYLQIDSGAPHCAFTLSGQTLRVCPTGLTAVVRFACCDLTRSNHPALWLITWDPTQPIATRPLAIQKDGTWYSAPARLASQGSRSQVCSRLGVWLLKSQPAYGWDLTKNICELYGSNGYIRTAYSYTPYGEVTESANGVYQPIQWSSEFNETELGLVYYNYRHYNPVDGRWLGRDAIGEMEGTNLYMFAFCNPLKFADQYGKNIPRPKEPIFIYPYVLKTDKKSIAIGYVEKNHVKDFYLMASKLAQKTKGGKQCYRVRVFQTGAATINDVKSRQCDIIMLIGHGRIKNTS